VPGVGAASLTSATGGRGHQRVERPARRTGAGVGCRSRGSARRWWPAGAFGKGRDHQEGVGDHGEGGPAPRGLPTLAALVRSSGPHALTSQVTIYGWSTTPSNRREPHQASTLRRANL